jgi:hypothetical protein
MYYTQCPTSGRSAGRFLAKRTKVCKVFAEASGYKGMKTQGSAESELILLARPGQLAD